MVVFRISVRLGEWNISSTQDCSGVDKYRECNPPVIDVAVSKSIVHPEYVDSSKQKYNDIALLRLQEPVSYSGKISSLIQTAFVFV